MLDSNGFRSVFILDNQMRLISFIPTRATSIPVLLANAWAIAPDSQTVYFCGSTPRAKWSGRRRSPPMTTPSGYDDAPKGHQGPWFNNYHTTEVVAVEKIDDHTILVKAAAAKAARSSTHRLWAPSPSTTTRWARNWVKQYNWGRGKPTTGPYVMSDVKKGSPSPSASRRSGGQKTIATTSTQVQPRHHHAAQVIRDHNIAFRHFLKGSWTPSR